MFDKLKPLLIGLDGTLIRSNLLLESSLLYIKLNPFRFYRLFLWLMKGGKMCLKRNLTKQVSLEVKYLPYNQNVIEWLHEEKKLGRALILATASYKEQVDQIANHVGLFDQILASEGDSNLSVQNKSNKLISLFEKRGFDYAGNSKADLEIWKHADKAILVFPKRNIERHADLFGNVKKIIQTNSFPWGSWVRGLRIHQWVKNFLIFFPYMLGHYFYSTFLLWDEVFAFLFFSLCASSVYIFNDLLDLQEDRQDNKKKYRPFAEGTISIKTGLLVSCSLTFATILLSFFFRQCVFSI